MAYPMDFAATPNDESIDLVAKMVVFDPGHDNRLLQLVGSEVLFHFFGLMELGHEKYTILNGILKQQFPIALVTKGPLTKIFNHDVPTWETLHTAIDACSGFGRFAHGLSAAGFFTSVAVDVNWKMLELHKVHSSAELVHRDIGLNDTIARYGIAAKMLGYSLLATRVSLSALLVTDVEAYIRERSRFPKSCVLHTICRFQPLPWNVSNQPKMMNMLHNALITLSKRLDTTPLS